MEKEGVAGSPGFRFRAAMKKEMPLQIVGAVNANHALLATQAGFNAIYLSGGAVAAGSLGIPDLGITTLEDVLIDISRIHSESMTTHQLHLTSLIEQHVAETGSAWGTEILNDFRSYAGKFWLVKPKAASIDSLIENLRRAA